MAIPPVGYSEKDFQGLTPLAKVRPSQRPSHVVKDGYGLKWNYTCAASSASWRAPSLIFAAKRDAAPAFHNRHEKEKFLAGVLPNLISPQTQLRQQAFTELGEKADEEIKEILFEFLNDPHPFCTKLGGDSSCKPDKIVFAIAIALAHLGDKRSLDYLVTALRLSTTSDESHLPILLEAVRGLGRLGDPAAVEPVMGRLKDSAIEVKVEAVKVLSDFKDKRAMDLLLESLKNLRSVVLTRLDQPSGYKRMSDPQGDQIAYDYAKALIHALVKFGDKRAEGPLIEMLEANKYHKYLGEDYSYEIKLLVIEALGSLGSERSVKSLTEFLEEERLHNLKPTELEGLRALAAKALGDLLNPDAKDVLFDLLDDANSEVRFQAFSSLNRLGDGQAAYDHLIDKLESHSAWSVETLGRIGLSRSVGKLEAVLQLAFFGAVLRSAFFNFDVEFITEVITALARMGKPSSVLWIISYLKHKEALVRQAAASALGNFRDERALKPLTEALRGDEDKLVRQAAATSLGKLGDPRAMPILTAFTHDPDSQVASAAREALKRLVEDSVPEKRRVRPGGKKETEAPPVSISEKDKTKFPTTLAFVGIGDVSDKLEAGLLKAVEIGFRRGLQEKGIQARELDVSSAMDRIEVKPENCTDVGCTAEIAGAFGYDAGIYGAVMAVTASQEYYFQLHYVPQATPEVLASVDHAVPLANLQNIEQARAIGKEMAIKMVQALLELKQKAPTK